MPWCSIIGRTVAHRTATPFRYILGNPSSIPSLPLTTWTMLAWSARPRIPTGGHPPALRIDSRPFGGYPVCRSLFLLIETDAFRVSRHCPLTLSAISAFALGREGQRGGAATSTTT